MTTLDELGAQLEEIKNKSCAGRIKESLNSLNEDLTKTMNDPNYDDYFSDQILAIDIYKVTKLCLSYGGPSSFIEVTTNKEGEIMSIIYRFSDWYDTATIEIEEGSPAYEYAVQTLENMES
jgi:hypothetical protein